MLDFEMHLNVDDVIQMLIVDDIDDVNEMDYDYVELVMVIEDEILAVKEMKMVDVNMNNLMIDMVENDYLKNLHHHWNQLFH
jgi:hypothetical protein